MAFAAAVSHESPFEIGDVIDLVGDPVCMPGEPLLRYGIVVEKQRRNDLGSAFHYVGLMTGAACVFPNAFAELTASSKLNKSMFTTGPLFSDIHMPDLNNLLRCALQHAEHKGILRPRAAAML